MGYYLMVFLAIFGVLAWRFFYVFWWRPMKLGRFIKDQGINGPPYWPMVGNMMEEARLKNEAKSRPMDLSHAIAPRVIPFLYQTFESYGRSSMAWFGVNPRVTIMDPELIREVFSNKEGHFEKATQSPIFKVLVTGLVNHEGDKWAKHRRIINPAFHQEKLKRMFPAFHTSCCELISKWEESVGSEGESCELDVWPEFQNFTGDVISRTAFGSSYKQGMRIFQLQTEQAQLFSHSVKSVLIPGYRFLPVRVNKRRNEIDKEVCALLRGMIKEREKEMKMGNVSSNDLLGLLMESNFRDSQEQGNSNAAAMTTEEVIDECKLFYFAGQETTSVLLTWTMVILSMHPNWQMKAREEVLQVFGKNKPDFDGLNHLKIVTMILYEVLRLYPPVVYTVRRVAKTTKLGDITLPAGAQVSLPTLLMHHDPEIWGEDVEEFKPERFSEGVAKASKNRTVFFPFNWGPRICIGQNFALIEAKMALAMILQQFSFELSPSYAHAPFAAVTLQPQHGAQIILHRH
ncbi:hypothetical protein MRB53_015688 [Persea americana]|uniref:Uncharacterized protein n=1 Tax=Persea americana TaxID=3435 RepID=A0ACC2LZX0_PERAE|nr:hypothetical protein MRB53_015688 [Persea americana]